MNWDDDEWDMPILSTHAENFEDEDEDLKRGDLKERLISQRECTQVPDRKLKKQRYSSLGKKKRKANEQAKLRAKIGAPAILPRTQRDKEELQRKQNKTIQDDILDLFGGESLDIKDEDNEDNEDNEGSESFKMLCPTTQEEFEKLADVLIQKIVIHQNDMHYFHLIHHLLQHILVTLDINAINRLSLLISTQGTKIKKEKQNKKRTWRSKPQLIKRRTSKSANITQDFIEDPYDNLIL